MHIPDLLAFLSELKENNNRAWFVMNKPRYDILREEFFSLTSSILAEVIAFDPAMRSCDPKKAMFRINRDIRFAKERHPYKTTFSASMNADNIKRPHLGGGPVYYFHINVLGELLVGAGEWMPPPARLKALRRHLESDQKGFGKVLKNKAFAGCYGDLQDDAMLKKIPKGFDDSGTYAEYLRYKSLFCYVEQPLRKISPARLEDEIVTGFASALPLVKWLRETVQDEQDE